MSTNMKVSLYRAPTGGGSRFLSATYGQVQEFNNALPGLLGPLHLLTKFERDTHVEPNTEILFIERITESGDRLRTRYLLVHG